MARGWHGGSCEVEPGHAGLCQQLHVRSRQSRRATRWSRRMGGVPWTTIAPFSKQEQADWHCCDHVPAASRWLARSRGPAEASDMEATALSSANPVPIVGARPTQVFSAPCDRFPCFSGKGGGTATGFFFTAEWKSWSKGKLQPPATTLRSDDLPVRDR